MSEHTPEAVAALRREHSEAGGNNSMDSYLVWLERQLIETRDALARVQAALSEVERTLAEIGDAL